MQGQNVAQQPEKNRVSKKTKTRSDGPIELVVVQSRGTAQQSNKP
jgi:hypothetical protein